MIKGQLVGAQAVLAQWGRLAGALHGRMVIAVTRLSILVQSYVKQSKLSGQVLKTRTGTLRRSINRRVVDKNNEVSATVGTNVVYGRVHEYGFKGVETVREHLRRVKQAWGRPIEERLARVRAHPRNVNIPARSYLRSSLRDKRDEIIRTLANAAELSKTQGKV